MKQVLPETVTGKGGSERELEGVAAILGRGNSAEHQLRIFNANRDIIEVAEEIALATETAPALSQG